MEARTWWMSLPLVALVLLIAVDARGQEETGEELFAWVEPMARQIAGVRFGESDVQSCLRYWDEFSEIGEADEDPDEDWQELTSLDWILQNPEYRAWAAAHGLDARDWVLKTMRITMMTMREVMQEHSATAQRDMARHMAELEAQCAQVGPELCKQMKETMAGTTAMVQSTASVWQKVPEPTAAEQELLDRYSLQLRALIGDEF